MNIKLIGLLVGVVFTGVTVFRYLKYTEGNARIAMFEALRIAAPEVNGREIYGMRGQP
jgi:hypothetical protein